LHRARAAIDALVKAGVERPRLLFTTYTNALVRFSEQLLTSLLGPRAPFVSVRTADSLAMEIARQSGNSFAIIDHREWLALVEMAIGKASFAGNALQRKAQAQTIERLGSEYVADEITGVIEARRISTIEAYQGAARPGRAVALNRVQREAVWRVRDA